MKGRRELATKNPTGTTGFGVLSDRVQKLIASTKTVEPWQLTDRITVSPPTKNRRDRINAAQVKIQGLYRTLDEAARKEIPQPVRPSEPDALKSSATARQKTAHAKATAAFAEKLTDWEAESAKWTSDINAHSELLTTLTKQVNDAAADYERELFGPTYAEVVEFFGEQDPAVWAAFKLDVAQHFGLIAKAPTVPDDGRCPECGNLTDAEQAGKAPTSST